MKHGFGSIGLWNIRRNSMSPAIRSSSATSPSSALRVASSLSARASSKSSELSLSRRSRSPSVDTTPSSCFFSRPSSCARLGSSQTFGSSSPLTTVFSRSDLASKSKIPPQIGSALLQTCKEVGELIDAFGFHGTGVESLGARSSSHYTGTEGRSRRVVSPSDRISYDMNAKRNETNRKP